MATKRTVITKTDSKHDIISYVVACELPENATKRAQSLIDDGYVIWGLPQFMTYADAIPRWHQIFIKYKGEE